MMQPIRIATERLVMRALLFALALLFVVLAVPFLFRMLSPFIIALPIAAMLQPLIRFCQKKLHFKRGLAVGIWVTLVCALAFLIIYWFISFAVGQIIGAAKNAPAIVQTISDALQTAAEKLLSASDRMTDTLSESIRSAITSAINVISNTITGFAKDFLGGTVNVAAALPNALIYANFLILGIYFLTSRYDGLRETVLRRRDDNNSESVAVLRKTAGKGIVGYLRVQVIFALIHLLVSWVYLQSFGVPYAVLLALLAAMLELIPLFGCGLLYVPWGLLAFIVGNASSAWIALGMYCAWSIIRRMVEPKMISNNIGLSPLLSLVGMFVGMQLGGVWGLILGPIAMLIIVAAVHGRLFDGIAADFRTIVTFLRERWYGKRAQTSGSTKEGKP